MIQRNKRLVGWVRLDGNQEVIPSSYQLRPLGFQPKDGEWIQVTSNYCCAQDLNGYVLVSNTTASANVTHIVAGRFTWTGTLANGGKLIIPLFNSYDYDVVITVDTPTGRTITTATLQGTGTITTGGVITVASNTYHTTATLNGQYSIVLS